MSKELELKHRVTAELEWDPSVQAAGIGVATSDGVVTLTGTVTSYIEKLIAERAAKRVSGVRGVANEIEVRPNVTQARNDTEIATAALRALDWNSALPFHAITVKVAAGWVTLDGTVAQSYQREAAHATVRTLRGVKGVTNLIVVAPQVRPDDVQSRILSALKRSAEVDAKHINVETAGTKVTLRGKVRSWAEREEAERAAWSAPGVASVQDDILVDA